MKRFVSSLLIAFAGFSVYAQSSTLWEVSGNDLKQPSYIFGALKFIGEKEFALPQPVIDKLLACKTFAIEDQVDHHAQHELNKALHYPKGKSLASSLSPEDYTKTVAFFEKEFVINKAKFESHYARLIPLALSIAMTRLSMGEGVRFYDMELLVLAKNNKLETYSLEATTREAQAIKKYPITDQVVALMHSINNFERQKEEYKNLEAAYLTGDLDKVFEYTLHPTENNPVFIEEFYTKRNKEWLPKIQKMMKNKASFITLGVAHLEGENGILALLKANGYSVTPLPVK